MLVGGITFTKLDISQAYQQLVLDDLKEALSLLIPIKGFSYQSLPFGISSTLGIFLRTIETILVGVPRVLAYLDDILNYNWSILRVAYV